jgi:hypothetical protein
MKPEGKQAGRDEGEKGATSGFPTFLRTCLPFFVLSFVYLWLVVEPQLLYYCFGTVLPNAPLFTTGWPFLKDSLSVPGGAAAYVGGFLSLGFSYAWLGAVIITLAGFSLAELSRRHLVRAGLAHASLAATLPALMFFSIYSCYKHPLTLGLAVALGLLLSLLFESLPWRRRLARVPVCGLLAAVGFWLGGGGALLVFAAMTAIYGVLGHPSGRVCTAHQQPSDGMSDGVPCTPHQRPRAVWNARVSRDRTAAALALLTSGLVAWVLAECVFLLPADQAFLILTPFAPIQTASMSTFLQVLMFLLYGFVPLAVLLVLAVRSPAAWYRHRHALRARKTPGKKKPKARDRQRKTPLFRPLSSVLRPLSSVLHPLSVVPIALMALALYFSHDSLRKSYVLSNYYSCQKRWDKIVELNRHLPGSRNNVFVNHDLNRALYHAGRLPYDLFRYPQDPQALLLTHERSESDLTQWKLSDIFLELGHVNMAEKLASELLSTKSQFSPALEELGWITVIKGCPATARIYWQALKKDPLYRGRAASLLDGLDHGFPPEQTACITRIRSYLRDQPADVTGREPVDETLAALLQQNPRNKMAFEYLMACYLFTGRVDQIVENMDKLPALGYQTIPTLYEEAILIHLGSRGQQLDLSRFNINPQTLRRYEAFVRLSSTLQPQNQAAVLDRLIRDFGTTYFFYYTFGRVGLAPGR